MTPKIAECLIMQNNNLPFLMFSTVAANNGAFIELLNQSQKFNNSCSVHICSMRQSSILWLAVNTSLHSSILPI